MPVMDYCDDVEAYVTKDGSLIRELMHPQVHVNSSLSLAEAGCTRQFHTFTPPQCNRRNIPYSGRYRNAYTWRWVYRSKSR
jgi:hypothetical protein